MDRTTKPDAALRQVGLDGQQFGRAARKPVGLGDGQHVAGRVARAAKDVVSRT
jgi:hypothetical protein